MRLRSGKSGSYLHTLSAVFVLGGLLFRIRSGGDSGPLAPEAGFRQNQDYSLFERERLYAGHVVHKNKSVTNDTTALFLCRNCATRAENAKRIIALVEVRNVAHTLYGFLRSVEDVVDAIVVLDDHSVDGSRADIFEMCHVRGTDVCKVEVVLNKTGPWIREELRDRDLLLQTGRAIGGTHFVLLDYDEYFSANCVTNGLLRDRISALKPGQSLFVPWVEMWKSAHLHRVLPGDREMNFLIRRQTVIFADDGKVQYSRNSTNARTLGGRSGTIHALRCPRTICPRPPKYVGPQVVAISDPRVKRLPKQCQLIETRFLHLPNILLKSAWYQGLGRMMGAKESSTRGKMLDVLFPSEKSAMSRVVQPPGTRSRTSGVSLAVVGKDWLTARNEWDARGSRSVELWRAEELVRWLDEGGDKQFSNLSAIGYTDTTSLRDAMARSSLFSDSKMVHVPRQKRGTFVVAIEDKQARCASKFLEAQGTRVEISGIPTVLFPDAVSHVVLHRLLREGSDFEDGRLHFQSAVRSGITKSRNGIAYFSAAGMAESELVSLVKLAADDLSDFDVVFLFSRMTKRGERTQLKQTVEAAIVPGSHLRVIKMEPSAFGSYAALSWLRFRLSGTHECSLSEKKALLSLAEKFHSREWQPLIPNMLPVSRAIFSLNVGRSGSKYLAAIMSSLGRGVRGYHEPRCPDGKCSGGGAMAMQKVKLAESYTTRMDIKLPMIRMGIANISDDGLDAAVELDGAGRDKCAQVIEGLHGMSPRFVYEASGGCGCGRWRIRDFIYAETNPNFKSWFYDVTLDHLPKMGYNVSVIVLRKYMAAALKSLYETGYFSVRNGYNWMETANGMNSEVRSIGKEDELDAYDKLISYLVNAEAVARKIIGKYGREEEGEFPVRFVEMRSEEMYSSTGTMRLLAILGLRPKWETAGKAGKREDKYGNGMGKRKVRQTSLVECERRLQSYLAKSKEEGISLPPDMEQLKRSPGFQYSEN